MIRNRPPPSFRYWMTAAEARKTGCRAQCYGAFKGLFWLGISLS
jgi:hypothetical protein